MSILKNKVREIFNNAISKENYEEGINEIESLIKNKVIKDEEIFYNLGFLCDHHSFDVNSKKRKELQEKAIKLYKKALKINSNYYNATWGIARVYGYRKDKKALFYAKEAYQKHKEESRNEDFAQNVASIYNILGDYKKAEEWYKKPLDKTDQPGMFANIINFYIKTNQTDKIEPFLEKGRKLFKEKPESFKKSLVGKNIKKVFEYKDKK